MKHFYVVGNRASKSLSPLIFNHWFKKYNIKAKYSFLEVSEKGFDKMLTKHIKGEKTNGLNITIPFKKNILKHLDVEDAHSKNIGAVNCVTIGKTLTYFAVINVESWHYRRSSRENSPNGLDPKSS